MELVEATGWLDRQGDAHLRLARVHARAGNPRAAAEAASRALERGHVPGAAEARDFVETLGAAPGVA